MSVTIFLRATVCMATSFLISVLAAQEVKPQNIEIIRDTFGVPHIYAPTDAEVAYGLAWAHAEDDFETIQLTLLGAKQMLGRHLGKEGAMVDYVAGLLGCRQVVREHREDLSPDFVRVMEGYIAGLNAYARIHPREVLVRRAFPVTLEDMLQAYVLSLSVMLGADDAIRDLVSNEVADVWQGSRGSNGFAISRERTTDQQVYLAINSHQPLEGPASWYEAHLVSEEGWNAMGGLFPGGAMIFHGTNTHLGWAHTVNHPDKLDIWQLEMKPGDPDIYLVDGEELMLNRQRVKLKVKIAPGLVIGVRKKIYHSIYGPVIKNDKGSYAFDVAALHDLRVAEQWYRMNKATDFDTFREALEMMALPMFNIIYGDREGHIFYVDNALLPIRHSDYDWSGVVPGNTRKTLYNGFHGFDELPMLLDPSSGYVFNTNHSPFLATGEGQNLSPEDFDPTMGFRLWDNNRSLRFRELIESYERLSYEDFLSIKYDLRLPDSLAFFLDMNGLFRLDREQLPEVETMLGLLQQWDREAAPDRVGPAQFIVLYWYLKQKLNAGPPEIYPPSRDEWLDGLRYTQDYFMEHFGRLDVTLGEFQVLVRGEKELPLKGMPDVLAAMYSRPYRDGKVAGVAGESYIMLVRYPEEGWPVIETVNVYGASNRPESRHYDDQMEMFVAGRRKPMTLDIKKVREFAERIYHPE